MRSESARWAGKTRHSHLALSLGTLTWHYHHRAAGRFEHARGDAADEKRVEGSAAMGAHDDHAGSVNLRLLKDFFGNRTLDMEGQYFPPLSCGRVF